jgi:predicted regulator of Ras-like GTPase activity (Roadblock/LC7/MglB family)
MNHSLIAILASLRDIEGVLGSFIWLSDGQVLATDMPEDCQPETIDAVAARVQRLCEAFTGMGQHFESTTLAFAQYRLHVCTQEHAFVAAVLANHVNMAALKMAAKLALRELSFLLAHPSTTRARLPAAKPEDQQPPATSGARSYRGQRLPS